MDALISKLREGDTIIVWKMDRIARSVSHMLRLVDDFKSKEVSFKSIMRPFIDTTSAHGEFIFTILVQSLN